jgi:hypothetical protein
MMQDINIRVIQHVVGAHHLAYVQNQLGTAVD